MQVRLNRSFPVLAMFATALAFICVGCSGINTGTTVSPASFFLPGLLKNDAPTNAPVSFPQNSKELAKN
jgi:hypothetical protein